MAFDPDAFLAAGTVSQAASTPAASTPAPFDPDAFLSSPTPATAPETSTAQAAGRGAVQGLTAGFADEADAGIEYGLSKIPGVRTIAQKVRGLFPHTETLPPVDDPNVTYAERRDARRALDKAAEQAHPLAYTGGEIAGSLAPALVSGGGTAAATGVRGAAVQAAKTGAAYGAAGGLGSSEADLTKGEFGKALKDTAVSAATGAATGAVLGAAGAKLVKSAPKNAQQWVVKDIVGDVRGASTATAKKQLADDAFAVQKLTREDKQLDKAIDHARHNDHDALQTLQGELDTRLNTIGQKLDPHWAEVDQALDGKLTSGRVVNFLQDRIEKLRATAKTSDSAEASALENIVGRIKGGSDWGYGARFVPETVLDDGYTAAQKLQLLQRVRNGKNAAEVDAEIARIRKLASARGFDPDHVVSARQVQGLWSDEAGIAYKSFGGVNGTPTFERKLDVAHNLRDIRDEILDEAEKAGAKVKDLRELNKRYSGLKRIQQVIDQRSNRATIDAAGASVPSTLHQLGHAAAHAGPMAALGTAGLSIAMGHPGVAATTIGLPYALKAGIASKRMLDRFTARMIEDAAGAGPAAARAQRYLRLIQKGIPAAAAFNMARSTAAPDGILNQVAN